MGMGEMGVGEMGVGETGTPHNDNHLNGMRAYVWNRQT